MHAVRTFRTLVMVRTGKEANFREKKSSNDDKQGSQQRRQNRSVQGKTVRSSGVGRGANDLPLACVPANFWRDDKRGYRSKLTNTKHCTNNAKV